MIKNLNQLKRALWPGMRLEIIDHCRSECIGQLREVTWVNTQGFYTKVVNQPDNKINAGNNGRGAIISTHCQRRICWRVKPMSAAEVTLNFWKRISNIHLRKCGCYGGKKKFMCVCT